MEDRIYDRILDLDYQAYRDAAFRGTRADIAVPSTYGGTVVIEAKSWRPEIYRASASPYLASAEHYESLGAHQIVALDESYGRYPIETPFVFEGDLPQRLEELAGGTQACPEPPLGLEPDPIDIFIAMPFSDEFIDVYFNAMAPAAAAVTARAYREDYDGESGDILSRIKARIMSSAFVAADITSLRPNVLYEIGWAHANEKRVVIAATADTEIPFDIAHERVTRYDWNNKHQLRLDLTREFGKEMRAIDLSDSADQSGRSLELPTSP